MKYDSDEALAEELSRIGRAISPSPDGLRAALKGEAKAVPSPFLVTTFYSYTKLAGALAVLVVLVGGTYYLSVPGAPTGTGEVALLQTESLSTEVQDSGATAMKMMAPANAVLPPADDSFEGFEAAVAADLAAQEAAIQEMDSDADFAAVSLSSKSNSQALYDPESI